MKFPVTWKHSQNLVLLFFKDISSVTIFIFTHFYLFIWSSPENRPHPSPGTIVSQDEFKAWLRLVLPLFILKNMDFCSQKYQILGCFFIMQLLGSSFSMALGTVIFSRMCFQFFGSRFVSPGYVNFETFKLKHVSHYMQRRLGFLIKIRINF